jgi:hypothetical protein
MQKRIELLNGRLIFTEAAWKGEIPIRKTPFAKAGVFI